MKHDQLSTTAAQPAGGAGGAVLEVGWLVCQPASPLLEETATEVLARLRKHLGALAPDFSWQWRERSVTPDAVGNGAIEVMSLVESGIALLDSEHLDFVFVLTDQAISGNQGQGIRAASSSAAGVSVVSLDAFSRQHQVDLSDRVCAVCVVLFGHMLGIDTLESHRIIVEDSTDPDADATVSQFLRADRAVLVSALERAADSRVEERGMRAGMVFYLASVKENWREILRSIVRVRPWMMPFKLGRLTAAAASALFVLLLTAEVWELGMSQTPVKLWVLSIVSLVGTSVFVLARQRLLMASRSRLSEQIAVMRVAITFGVFSGMLSTYLVLFVTSIAAALLLFPADLALRWSGLAVPSLAWAAYLGLAAFVSALGVIIGALGASFERQGHLKQLAMLDAEF